MKYYSQLEQDKFVDDYFNHKENGVFIEIGAHDGVSCSNTKFFEEFRNWTGICIEPGPVEFEKLKQNRTSININACVSNYDGQSEYTYIEGRSMMLSGLSEDYIESHERRIEYETDLYGDKVNKIAIPVFKLQTILDNHGIFNIDYCSIDTEGSEYNIIRSIDFDKTNIKIFSIENNYGDVHIKNHLEKKGFVLHTKIKWDDIFIKL